MGYFSNGTEGMDYQSRYCSKCLHDNPKTDLMCPVWQAHMIRNYQDCNDKGAALHMLIPRADDGLGNDKCRMFIDRGLLSNLAIQKFEHDAKQD